MSQVESIDQEDDSKVEEYIKGFSGGLFLLPDSETEQLALAERALYWVLTGVYPDSQTSIEVDSHSEGFVEAVQAEVSKQLEILKTDLGVKVWRASYDYWDYGDGPNFVKGGVSVYRRKGIDNLILSVSTHASKNDFFGENIVGISSKAFEPLLNTSWRREEFDHGRSKANPEARKEAHADFDTIIKNLNLDKDQIYREMKDYALYKFYDKVLGYKRIESILSEMHGGELKPGELIDTLEKNINQVFEKLTAEEKELVCMEEKKILTSADIKLPGLLSETPIEVSYNFNLSLVPCRIDRSGNFIWETDNASSYSVETTTKPIVDRKTTPQKLAKAKLQAEKAFLDSVKGTNLGHAVRRTWTID